jgi:Domain of unknown function (DUF4070)
LPAPFDAPNVNDLGDQCSAGLNFITLRSRRDILLDYKEVVQAIYQPGSYFRRVRMVGRSLRRPKLGVKFNAKLALHELTFLSKLMWHMTVTRPALRKPFWGAMADIARHNPSALESVIALIAFYVHLGKFAEFLLRDIDRKIEELERQSEAEVLRLAALAAA